MDVEDIYLDPDFIAKLSNGETVECDGGYFFREWDFCEHIKKMREHGFHIVGIKLEVKEHRVEFIVERVCNEKIEGEPETGAE